MPQLIAKPELATGLLDYLAHQTSTGHTWVVYDADSPIAGTWDLTCFRFQLEALDFEREYQQIFNWHIAVRISDLSIALKEIEYSLKNRDMNRNSLEDFRDQTKALKIPQEIAAKIEEGMEKDLHYIQATGHLPSRKGYMEATVHVKRSLQSDYYFLNKYDLSYSKAKPLEEGKQYLVMSTDAEGKPQFKKFDSPIEAIDNFKKRDGNAELGIGKSVKDYQSVATMKEGKVDYVSKDFQLTYYSEPIKNTLYVNEGKGFNMKQGANMLMGGAAFRNDLVSRVGKQYEAWNTYQFDQPRDRYGNLTIRQYGEGYPFNLNSELTSYKIKELDDPKKLDEIISQMKDGERPIVTVVNEQGEELKMMARAMPRYGNINFYNLSGQVEKREQYLKEPKLDKAQENIFEKKMNQQKSQGQGMAM